MCPSLIEIGSKTAEKNSAQTNKQTNKQTNRQTDRHYENNGHLAVNQLLYLCVLLFCATCLVNKDVYIACHASVVNATWRLLPAVVSSAFSVFSSTRSPREVWSAYSVHRERQFRRLSTRPPLTNCAPFLAVWFWHLSCCPLFSCFRPNFLFRSSTVSVRHSHLNDVVGTILLLAFNTGLYGEYGRSPVPRAFGEVIGLLVNIVNIVNIVMIEICKTQCH